MYRPVVCDYCLEPRPHVIKLSRRLNGESLKAELCRQCIEDIIKAMKDEAK